MPWRWLEDRSFADAAFRAEGRTPQELFAASAEALLAAMLADPGSLAAAEEREAILSAPSLGMLLFDFLQEIVYLKDAESLLLRADGVEIRGGSDGGPPELRAHLRGERIDPARHRLLSDVKAVTLHRFVVERVPGGWAAEVVLDV
jgi:SHS2 domain-containing protein